MKQLYTSLTLGLSLAFYTLQAQTPFYQTSCGTYSPISGSGTNVPVGYNALSTALPLGFNFDYFGTTYSTCYVSSNGFLTFTAAGGPGFSAQTLPSSSFADMVAFAWTPHYIPTSGTVSYFTQGSAGSRVFILNFTNVSQYYYSNNTTVQVHLYEGSNEIRILSDQNNQSYNATMGLNRNGSVAYVVPGRNNTTWSANNECLRFIPYTNPANDVGVVGFTGLAVPIAAGTQAISATIKNYGSATLTSADINWSIDGVPQTPFAWTGSLASGAEATVSIGSVVFTMPSSRTIHASTTNPNGMADGFIHNDAHTQTFHTGLSGTYTVYGAAPDFADFNSAVHALNTRGILGNVIFNFRSGTYSQFFSLGAFPGHGTFTTTFRAESGVASDVILTRTGSGSLVSLNNVNGVRFEDLTLQPLAYYNGVELLNEVNGLIFNEVTFSLPVGGYGIYGNNVRADNFSVTQCIFNGGSYPIYMGNYDSGNHSAGIVVSGNTFNNFTQYGIYLYYYFSGLNISGNTFSSTSTGVIGIYLSPLYDTNGSISANNFMGLGDNSRSMYLYSLTASAGSPFNVFNNMMKFSGSNSGVAVSADYCSYLNFDFNTVSCTNTYVDSDAASFTGNNNFNLRNNIFSNTGGGQALIMNSNSSSTIDRNCYYSSGAVLGSFNSVNQANLSAWQSATTQDAASISANPYFLSASDPHVTQIALNEAAMPLAHVSVDFEGNARNATNPDIGGDEFTPPPTDGGLEYFNSPVMPFASGSNPVNVRFTNFGTSTITSASIEWTVNGVSQGTFAWSGSLATGQSANVVLGNFTFNPGVSYILVATLLSANGAADGYAGNNQITTPTIYPALCGTYTVGGAAPDFATLADAVTALNYRGVSCAVVFNIRNGSYTIPTLTIGNVAGASASNTITFKSETNDAANVTLTGGEYSFWLNGARYLRFTELTVASNYSYTSYLFETQGPVSNITIDNCVLNAPSPFGYSTSGFYCNSSNGIENFVFNDNQVTTYGYGVYIQNGGTLRGNIEIQRNQFVNQYYYGVYLSYLENILIRDNAFNTNQNSASYYAIHLTSTRNHAEVSGNTIINCPAYGIFLYSHDAPALANGAMVFNNFVHSIGAHSSYGIYSYYSNKVGIYFNSVNQLNTNSNSTALYIYAGNTVESKNNICVNVGGGRAIIAEYMSPYTFDYNNLYATGSNLGRYNGTNYANLVAWRGATGQEVNSISVAPLFVSATDLHTTNPAFNGTGTPVSGINTDIDGNSRHATTPDIGADEFTAPPNDAGVTALASPMMPFAVGSHSVSVTIKNFGTATLTSADVHCSINGTPLAIYNWTGSLASGAETNVTIGNFNFATLTNYNVVAFTSNPNGVADPVASNDQLTTTIHPSLCGSYTIGGAMPDFPTFAAATTALSDWGVSCAVVMNVRSGTYSESISVTDIPNTTATNTVTFQSETLNAADVTIAGTDYGITFSGGDYVTFRRFTVHTTAYYYPYGVYQNYQTSTNNEVSHCVFNSTSTAGYGAYPVYLQGNFNGMKVRNNTISTSYYGIYMYGTAEDVLVEGNTITDPTQYGMYLSSINDIIVRNNTITASVNTQDGIYAYGLGVNDGITQINNNIVTLGGNGNGIYLYAYGAVSNRIKVYNNMVSIGGTSQHYAIYLNSPYYVDLLHNSTNVLNTNPNSSAYYRYSGYYNYIYNNIFMNVGGGLAANWYYGSSNVYDNNDLYTTGANIGSLDGVNYTTLAAWKIATGQEANSLNVNPNYTSATDLHASNAALDQTGSPQGITTDIDGQARNLATPDIGADEFTSVVNDMAATALVAPVTGCGKSATEAVTMTILNNGTSPQSGFTVSYRVNAGGWVTETYSGTINAGLSANYTFTATFDMTTVQAYNIEVRTNLVGDVDVSNDLFSVTRNAYAPHVTSLTPSQTICQGQAVVLTATGGSSFGNYHWSTGHNGNTINVNPVATTTYHVTVTNADGCTAVLSTIVTANPAPGNPTVFGSNQWNVYGYEGNNFNYYMGSYTSATLNLTTSSHWAPNSSPSAAVGYTGCAVPNDNHSFSAKREGFPAGYYYIYADAWNDEASLLVNGAQVWSSFCCGSSATLIWQGNLTAASQLEARLIEYGSNSVLDLRFELCSPSAPPMSIAGVLSYYNCTAGTTLTAVGGTPGSGAQLYWYSGACGTENGGTAVGTGPSISVNPSVTTNYFVRYENACESSTCATATVTIIGPPPGNPAVFGANEWNVYAYTDNNFTSYAGSYVNTNFSVNTNSDFAAHLSPSHAPGYVGCVVQNDNHSYVLKRQGFPCGRYRLDINNFDENIEVLVDGASVFSAACCGFHSNIWTGDLGAATTVEVRLREFTGSSYANFSFVDIRTGGTITNSGPLGVCSGTSTATINNSSPAVGNGSVTYVWQRSPDNTLGSYVDLPASNVASFTPSDLIVSNTYYRRKMIDGCGTEYYSNVLAYYPLTGSAFISAGGSTTFCVGGSLVLTANSSSSYLWSTGENTQTITVTTGDTYRVTTTSVSGCTAVDDIVITVNPLPSPSIVPATQTICQGTSASLTASGGTSYSWSSGHGGAAILVSPSTTTTYTVTATNLGCTATATATVSVTPSPNGLITPSGPTSFCNGGTVDLTASGGTLFAWNTGITGPMITVTTPGTYTVTISDALCSTVVSQVVSVFYPSVNITNSGSSYLCPAGEATLTANPNYTAVGYLWSNGSTNSSIGVSSAATYWVTVQDVNGCTSTDDYILNAASNPVLVITPSNVNTCNGSPVTLTANGANTYVWSTGHSGNTLTFNATVNTTYSVTGTNGFGCSATASRAVNVSGNAPVLSYSGNAGFVSDVVSPTLGNPYVPYRFEVKFTDADGDLPASGYPKVYLDYENDGSFLGPNDRVFAMLEADPTDVNTTDGKVYYYLASGLTTGQNYRTHFRANDGNNCPAVNFGPFNQPDILDEADIFIFANDITFSIPHPAVCQPFTVSAVVHNNSDYAAENFHVRLINQASPATVYPDVLVPYLGPHSNTTVTIAIPANSICTPSWNPMQVIVDYFDVVHEPNELDNSAVRPIIVGDYNVAGSIEVTSTVSPPTVVSSPSNWITVCGFAWYDDTAVPLVDTSVAGATVQFTIVETGQTYSGYTNSNGQFCIGFYAPIAPGVYTINGTVTDFTLTGNFTNSFTVLPAPCNQDMWVNVEWLTDPIFVGQSSVPTVTVHNGCLPTTVNTELCFSLTGPGAPPTPGSPVTIIVPPMAANTSQTFPMSAITFPNPGTFALQARIDCADAVVEAFEWNNTDLDYITVLNQYIDIVAEGYLAGSPLPLCQQHNLGFRMHNAGTIASGSFNAEVLVYDGPTLIGTYPQSMASIPAGGYSFLTINNFTFPHLGNFDFLLRCDIPLPGGMVMESNEGNNEKNTVIGAYQCRPDFTINVIDVKPIDPVAGATNLQITANVYNGGNLAILTPIPFQFVVDGATYSSTIPGGLGTYASTTVVINNITVPDYDCHHVVATVDPANIFVEFDENNNQDDHLLEWDFYLGSHCNAMWWNYTHVINQPFNVDVALYNRGMYEASIVDVKFEYQAPGGGPWIDLGNASVSPVDYNVWCGYSALLPTVVSFPTAGIYHMRMTADPPNGTGAYDECDETNNVLIVPFEIVDLPDYRILSQYINPSLLNPAVGQPITFDVTYENIGINNTQALELAFMMNNDTISRQTVPGLNSGDTWTVTIPVSWSSTIPGAHIARAIIDNTNVVVETDELNNEATRAIIVGSLPDLICAGFSPNYTGQEFSAYNLTIENIGDDVCTADAQLWYVQSPGDTVYVGSVTLTVPAHSTRTGVVHTASFPPNTTFVVRVANATCTEARYDNNECIYPTNNLAVLVSGTNLTCGGSASGTVSASVTGGVLPYVYSWSNGGSSPTLTGINEGVYSVVVTDNNGNTASGAFTVTATIPTISVTATPTTNYPVGSITVNYPVPSSITSYTLYFGDGDSLITNAPGTFTHDYGRAGRYRACAVVTGGMSHLYRCEYCDSIEFTFSCDSFYADIDTFAAAGALDMIAAIHYPADIETVLFSVNGGSRGNVTSYGAPASYGYNMTYIMPLDTQVVCFYGFYNGGADSCVFCDTINHAPIDCSATSVVATAVGYPFGQIDVSYPPTAGIVSYVIETDAGHVINGTSPGSYTENFGATGNYDVCVKFRNIYGDSCEICQVLEITGCSMTASVTPSSPILTCTAPNALLTANALGATDYLWNTGATTQSINVVNAGTYSVTATSVGCSATSSATVTLDGSLPLAQVTPNTASLPCGGSQSLNATGGATYLWNTGETSSSITVYLTNTYTVTVTALNGCSATASASITVATCPGPVPVNDNPCNAAPLPFARSTYLGFSTYPLMSSTRYCNSMSYSTLTATMDPLVTSCGGLSGRGVWFKFVAPDCSVGGRVPFRIIPSTSNSGTNYDTKLAIFQSTGNICLGGTLTEIACDDDTGGAGHGCEGGGATTSSLYLSGNLIPGGEYYIYVDGHNGAGGEFELSIFADIPPPVVQANPAFPSSRIDITCTDLGIPMRWALRPVGATGSAFTGGGSANSGTVTYMNARPNTSYHIQRLATCAPGKFFMSNLVTHTTDPLPSGCQPITDLRCESSTTSTIVVSCTNQPGSLQMTTYWRAVGSSHVSILTLPANVVSGRAYYTINTALLPATAYDIWIYNTCSPGLYLLSNTIRCSTLGTSSLVSNATEEMTVSFDFENVQYEGINLNELGLWGIHLPEGLKEGSFSIQGNKLVFNPYVVDGHWEDHFDFVLAPNPTSGNTQLYMNLTEPTSDVLLTITDALGRTLKSDMMGEVNQGAIVELDTRNYPDGVYHVTLRTKESIISKKLVVKH